VNANLTDHSMQGLQEPHRFRISTNAHGLRTSHPMEPSDGDYRVAIMGDSTVFGWGVEDNESIAAVAEDVLRAQGHPNIKVINAGQPGYSTGMVGWLFDQTVSAYKPDLTIVFVSMHDFNRTLISDVERHLGPQSMSARIRCGLVKHVALYEWLRRWLYPLAHEAQLLPDVRSREARVPRVSDPERRMVLERMTKAAQGWGGEVALGFLPFHRDLMADGMASDRPGLMDAQAWSGTQSANLYDLRTCCGPGADDRTFTFDRGHLNALGNAEVGHALAIQLISHSAAQVD
jgi:lysophospholipase L1-like esterase